MRFGLLGPLVVHGEDGAPLAVSRPKWRLLLALLLLGEGRPVPVADLLEGLWDTERPASARNNLKTYISGLRKLFGADQDRLLVTAGGYQLRVRPDELDVSEFERRVGTARAAAVRGDLELAEAELGRALAVWRGAPMQDLPEVPALAAERSRLAERRLFVLEERAELRLALGKAADVAAELAPLTEQHPYRERMWATLLAALSQAGRRADALAAYQRARTRLVDELGVEPGPDLQRVHQAVLAGEIALGPAGDGRAPWTGSVPPPQQLPPPPAAFTGRRRERDLVESLLTGGGPAGPGDGGPLIVALDGPGGVGKSALAVHAAHRVRDRFPDGQLYVNLNGATAGLTPLAPAEVLGRFLRGLGVPAAAVPPELDERAVLLRSRLAGRRVLVVLDNARDAEQVLPLLPGQPGCAVLVTSREPLVTVDGAVRLHLDPLASLDAMALLGRIAGTERVAAEPAAAEAVVRWCGHLPLAVRIAGARLAARPDLAVASMADRLGDEHARLDRLELGGLSVRSSFHASYQTLLDGTGPDDREAARAFVLLGLPDGADLGLPLAAVLLDRPAPAAERTLDRLVDAQLLEPAAPERYRMHDLLRLFAREQAARVLAAADRAGALDRFWRGYLRAAVHLDQVYRPSSARCAVPAGGTEPAPLWFPDRDAAVRWLEAERANLMALAGQAAAADPPAADVVSGLADALYCVLKLRGHWQDWERLNKLALHAAEERGDRHALAHALNGIAGVRWRLDRHREMALAEYERSAVLFAELADGPAEAVALTNAGCVLLDLGRLDDAMDRQQQALAIWSQLGDRRGEASTLSTIAVIQFSQGRLAEAVKWQHRALAVRRAVSDRPGEGKVLFHLGALHRALGRAELALACHAESLTVHEEVGDLEGLVMVLVNLSEDHRMLDQLAEARRYAERAAGTAVEIGDRVAEAFALRELGHVRWAERDGAAARAAWRSALAAFDRFGATAEADRVRALLDRVGDTTPVPPGPRVPVVDRM